MQQGYKAKHKVKCNRATRWRVYCTRRDKHKVKCNRAIRWRVYSSIIHVGTNIKQLHICRPPRTVASSSTCRRPPDAAAAAEQQGFILSSESFNRLTVDHRKTTELAVTSCVLYIETLRCVINLRPGDAVLKRTLVWTNSRVSKVGRMMSYWLCATRSSTYQFVLCWELLISFRQKKHKQVV